MPDIFDPIRLGAIEAPNRILMAPLTRGRASREHVPTQIMQTYYTQRASAGLIITEATGISQEGLGWPYAPGIWSAEQVEAWKPVTEAVHEAGGRIMVQLWHMGRLVHPSFLDGARPVSSSETTAPGDAHTHDGKAPYAEARALEVNEIPRLLDDYARAARNAVAAGFDGIQLHAANGYLIDQFLRDGANHRTDDYGGSPENRVRLLREVTQTLVSEVGADRTAVRLSPNGETQGVTDSNPEPVFTLAAQALDALGIAFLELREPGPDGTFGRTDQLRLSPIIRQHFKGPLVLNSDYDRERARIDLESGLADAIAFGRPFISNPDLPARFAARSTLNPADMATFYSRGVEGYTDYPVLPALVA
jgi:2,4-dienoyl-CoA reductase-like NADH-dependent reductase (Old Yellow Enzyme family)